MHGLDESDALDRIDGDRAAAVRILHLINPALPDGGACTLRLLADVTSRLSSIRHDVVIIGCRRDVSLAHRCGVEPAGSIHPPTGLPLAGLHVLRRFIHSSGRAGARFSLVHAWTIQAAALAALAAPHTPRLVTPHVSPRPDLKSRYLMRVLDTSGTPMLPASTTVERECRAIHNAARRATLLPPAVDPDSPLMVDRQKVRSRWAQEQLITERTFVIGLLCEPLSVADAREAATVAARLAISGRDVRLLVHSQVDRRRQAGEFLHKLSKGNLIIVDDAVAEPWRIVSGLDAALSFNGRDDRPSPSVLPLLWALAAGVPAIVEDAGAVGSLLSHEIIEDGVTGFIVWRHDANAAADRIVRLYDHRAQAAGMGQAGRALVYDTHQISAYCARLKHAYELLLAERSAGGKFPSPSSGRRGVRGEGTSGARGGGDEGPFPRRVDAEPHSDGDRQGQVSVGGGVRAS